MSLLNKNSHDTIGQRVHYHGKLAIIFAAAVILCGLGYVYIHPIIIIPTFVLTLISGIHIGKVFSYTVFRRKKYVYN